MVGSIGDRRLKSGFLYASDMIGEWCRYDLDDKQRFADGKLRGSRGTPAIVTEEMDLVIIGIVRSSGMKGSPPSAKNRRLRSGPSNISGLERMVNNDANVYNILGWRTVGDGIPPARSVNFVNIIMIDVKNMPNGFVSDESLFLSLSKLNQHLSGIMMNSEQDNCWVGNYHHLKMIGRYHRPNLPH